LEEEKKGAGGKEFLLSARKGEIEEPKGGGNRSYWEKVTRSAWHGKGERGKRRFLRRGGGKKGSRVLIQDKGGGQWRDIFL